jgi:hypothetical protein
VTGVDNCGSTRTTACNPCVPLQQTCGVAAANACGSIGRINLAVGGTVTSSSAGTAPTDMTKAFDADAITIWFPQFSTMAWIAYQFAGAAQKVVTAYSVTSALDWPDTDPRSWTFDGSKDGTTWTTLDTRTNQLFENRSQTNFYTFANATAYNRYRLNITMNNGSPLNVHLAEIQLFP